MLSGHIVVAAIVLESIMCSTFIETPQEWVRQYNARGGVSEYNRGEHRVTVLITSKEVRNVPLQSMLRPKGGSEVFLVGPGVENSDIVAVLKWPNIKSLALEDCLFTDDSIFTFVRHAKIERLWINCMPATATGVSRLSGSKTLKHVNITTTDRDSISALQLNGMDSLQTLHMTMFALNKIMLSNMPKLEDIFATHEIDPRQLQKVELNDLPLLTDVNFSLAPLTELKIAKCQSLKEFRAKSSKLTDDNVRTIMNENPMLKLIRK